MPIVKPTVLAFLQNPWFKPGTHPRYHELYKIDQEFHRRVLLLSATGRALQRALGEELYRHVIWDNANPRHGETRDASFPPDVMHMIKSIARYDPAVILCFGRQAQDGMSEALLKAIRLAPVPSDGLKGPKVYYAPHPMARGSAIKHLEEIATRVKEICR